MVEVPGKRAFPNSISPRIQPRLHMSTPLVYLWTWCTPFTSKFIFPKYNPDMNSEQHTDSWCSLEVIPWGSQQNLRSSVPPCRYVLRQRGIPTVLLDLVEWSRQAEITQLDDAVGVQQHIGRLWETQRKNILHRDNMFDSPSSTQRMCKEVGEQISDWVTVSPKHGLSQMH